MRHAIIILALLVAACVPSSNTLAPPVTTISAWPTSSVPLSTIKGLVGDIPRNDVATLDLYVKSFDKLVFETEFDGADPWVRKWARVIHFRVIGSEDNTEIDNEHREAVNKTISLLADITGLEFRNKGRANFSIVISEKKVCSAKAYLYRNGAIVDAHVWIGTKFDMGSIAECVAEEISQSLGPFNDVAIVEQSLWRPPEQQTAHGLTWHDAVILRALYDERLRPGMHRDVALPIVRKIIAELLAELNRKVVAN